VNRGFDYFYGYFSDYIDPWDKSALGNSLFTDLQSNDELVTESSELSRDLHVGYLMQNKAEDAIMTHMALSPDDPFFLYYSMPLMGTSWSAPAVFLQRCSFPRSEYIEDDSVATAEYNYCALNVMIDEAIANLTCTLEANGLANNTVLIITADNGGSEIVRGNNYPFQGSKGEHFRGGLSSTAIIHSKLIPEEARGSTYEGLMHVTGKYVCMYFHMSCHFQLVRFSPYPSLFRLCNSVRAYVLLQIGFLP
jgi:arylsulfatase A-like enzyme